MNLKSRLLAALCVPVLFVSTGCLDSEQSLIINADGSGTLDVNYEIAEATVRRVQSMLKLSEILPESPEEAPAASPSDKFIPLLFAPTENDVRKQLDDYAKLGFTIDEFAFKNENAKRKVSFTLSFDDVSIFTKADFFHTYGFSLRKNTTGQYVIYNRPVTRENVPASSWNFSDPETKKKVVPFLNGFRFAINITVPGRVLKSNAHQMSGNALRWIYAFDADPYAIQKMQRDQLNVVFDASVAKLPLFEQPPRPE